MRTPRLTSLSHLDLTQVAGTILLRETAFFSAKLRRNFK